LTPTPAFTPATDALSEDQQTSIDENRPGALSGRVMTNDGQPLANIAVYVFDISHTSRRATVTGADGRFRIDDLAPGVYTLAPNAPGYMPATSSMLALSPSRRAPNYYRPGDTVTLMMERGGVITGRVTNAAGDPVVGVAVRVGERAEERLPQFSNFESQRSPSITDDRGVYRMYGLAPDRYIVAAGFGDDRYSFEPSPYAGDAPTYFPSATRETAR